MNKSEIITALHMFISKHCLCKYNLLIENEAAKILTTDTGNTDEINLSVSPLVYKKNFPANAFKRETDRNGKYYFNYVLNNIAFTVAPWDPSDKIFTKEADGFTCAFFKKQIPIAMPKFFTDGKIKRKLSKGLIRVISKEQAKDFVSKYNEEHTCISADTKFFVYTNGHGIPSIVPDAGSFIPCTISYNNKELSVTKGIELDGFDYELIHKQITAAEFLNWYAIWLLDLERECLGRAFSHAFKLCKDNYFTHFRDNSNDPSNLNDKEIFAYIMTNYINDIGETD